MKTWNDLTELEQAQSAYSDIYKDAHGFRPRHATAEQWNSIEWLNEQIDICVSQVETQIAREQLIEQENIIAVEQRINDIIKSGAKTRETAIRWLHEAFDTDGDNEYLAFNLGVPYGYFS